MKNKHAWYGNMLMFWGLANGFEIDSAVDAFGRRRVTRFHIAWRWNIGKLLRALLSQSMRLLCFLFLMPAVAALCLLVLFVLCAGYTAVVRGTAEQRDVFQAIKTIVSIF